VDEGRWEGRKMGNEWRGGEKNKWKEEGRDEGKRGEVGGC